jgi:hypothetical protein
MIFRGKGVGLGEGCFLSARMFVVGQEKNVSGSLPQPTHSFNIFFVS